MTPARGEARRLVLAGLGAACGRLALAGGSRRPSRAAPVEPFAEGVETLLLVGDAGQPAADEPLLRALASEAAKDPERTLVVFLGDNLYPNGLPASATRGGRKGERRLAAQADAALGAGARVLFLPGNHDWDGMRGDGLACGPPPGAVPREPLARGSSSRRGAAVPGRSSSRPRRASRSPSSTRSGGSTTRGPGPRARLALRGEERGGGRRPAPARRRARGRSPSCPTTRSRAEGRTATGRPTGRPTSSRFATPPPRSGSPSPGLGSLWVGYRDSKGTGQDLASRRYRRLRADLARPRRAPGALPGFRARPLPPGSRGARARGEVGPRLGLGDLPTGHGRLEAPVDPFRDDEGRVPAGPPRPGRYVPPDGLRGDGGREGQREFEPTSGRGA